MPIDRTAFNALIDYDGTNPTTASLWNKNTIKTVLLDPVDAEILTPDSITCAGTIKERGRTTALGDWITVPFNAANFSANTGSWTVTSAAVVDNQYTLIGNTLIWSMYIAWFVGTSTAAGSPTNLRIAPPVSVGAVLNSAARLAICYINGVVTDAYMSPGNPLTIATLSGAAFAGTVGFIGQVVYRIG